MMLILETAIAQRFSFAKFWNVGGFCGKQRSGVCSSFCVQRVELNDRHEMLRESGDGEESIETSEEE